ncbi:MAG: phosphotransferase family protein [Hyphomicrobiaceae bacterium]
MSEQLHTFEHEKLAAYLAAHVDGFSTLDGIVQFSDGQSNPTYRIESGDKTYVLRAKPPGKLLKSAHMVDREFRVMNALRDTGVPVPRMFHLTGDDSPLGTIFFVMEFVAGRIFWDPVLPDLTEDGRSQIFKSMGQTLATLHNIDPESIGLGDFGKPGNYFARQVDRWSQQYKATELEKYPDVDWLMDWLAGNMVEDDGTVALVHGDYRIDNMIFHKDRPEIAAILDWELSTLGHPLADLAYQCMQWRLPNHGFTRGLGDIDRTSLGIPSEETYVAVYCERRDIGKIANWNFYLVFSYFRLLAILQGVVRRAMDGNASNPRNHDLMRQAVPQLAADARSILQ